MSDGLWKTSWKENVWDIQSETKQNICQLSSTVITKASTDTMSKFLTFKGVANKLREQSTVGLLSCFLWSHTFWGCPLITFPTIIKHSNGLAAGHRVIIVIRPSDRVSAHHLAVVVVISSSSSSHLPTVTKYLGSSSAYKLVTFGQPVDII